LVHNNTILINDNAKLSEVVNGVDPVSVSFPQSKRPHLEIVRGIRCHFILPPDGSVVTEELCLDATVRDALEFAKLKFKLPAHRNL
jgi:hypothetical protein